MIAHAQASVDLAHSFVAQINQVILFPLITLLTVVALVIFLWGCFQFVYHAGSDTKRAEGRQHILWGVIGMLVMLSAYAILTIAGNTIGVDPDQYNRSGATSAPFRSPRPEARPEAYAPSTSPRPEARTDTTTESDDTDRQRSEVRPQIEAELRANTSLTDDEISTMASVLTDSSEYVQYRRQRIREIMCEETDNLSAETCAALE